MWLWVRGRPSPTPNFVKIAQGDIGYPFWANNTKNYLFRRFCGLRAHILRVTTVKFGVRLRTWDTLPALNFVNNCSGDLSLRGNFYQKFEIFEFFSYLSPYFYTNNVKILLKRTEDLGIHQWHKISSESLKGPAGIAIAPWRWCILISSFWYKFSPKGYILLSDFLIQNLPWGVTPRPAPSWQI